MVFVYILKNYNGNYYTGISKDIVRRFSEHNTGKSRSTSKNKPYMIVYLNQCYDYRNAHALEVYIKRVGAQKFLTNFLNNPDNSYGKINTAKQIELNNDLRLCNGSTYSNKLYNEEKFKSGCINDNSSVDNSNNSNTSPSDRGINYPLTTSVK